MWKYVKLVLGLMLLLSSIAGTVSMFNGEIEESARRIVENGVDAPGIIEKRTKHTVVGRLGRVAGGGVYYTMTYSFTTHEGKKYGGEINVTKEQAYGVSDGQPIRVRYHANQPSINAPIGFKEYMTEDDIQNLPYGTMVFSSVLMFFGALWLLWSAWSQTRPAAPAGYSARMPEPRTRTATRSARRPVAPGGKPAFGRR